MFDVGVHPVLLVLIAVLTAGAVALLLLHVYYRAKIGMCFISYADSSNATLRAVFELRRVARDAGYTVLLDLESELTGQAYEQAARRTILRSKLFLVVVTDEYDASEKCREELALADRSSGTDVLRVLVSTEDDADTSKSSAAGLQPIDLRGDGVDRVGLMRSRLAECANASGAMYRLWMKLFRTTLYQKTWPLIKLTPPELAHSAALLSLRISAGRRRHHPVGDFEWRGLRFRNRIGIAAGLDKNAVCLPGLERLGAGFVEIGTVLLTPWPGLQGQRRMSRLLRHEAIWNRMGFPSQGVDPIKARLSAFTKARRSGMLVGCNIGPNPGSLKGAEDVSDYLGIAAKELCELVRLLFDPADYFVVNLSSPNTAGLRGLLSDPRLCEDLLVPVRRTLSEMEDGAAGGASRPLLLKLPPEDADRVPWTAQALESVVGPIIERRACDGFVATNTSTHLSGQLAADLGSEALPGGVSGAPLRSLAIGTVRMLRGVIGDEFLIMGCGGVMGPEHVLEFMDAGAEVVQVYSGLVYRGPDLIRECALVP